MAESAWSPQKNGWRYVIERRLWSNFAGSAYEFARANGKVLRFWTPTAAQECADALNTTHPTQEADK